ncbi:MAG: hypothetical protein QM778_24455 [Myxococcales bacterium]
MSAHGAASQVRHAASTPPPCPRCYCQEEVLWPWAGFRVARVVWCLGLCVIVVLAPILASDILVMTPLTVLFLFAGGPLFGFAKQEPTCRVCGLARPSPGWHETPCRPLRGLASSRLKVQRSGQPEPPVEESGVRELPKRRPAGE